MPLTTHPHFFRDACIVAVSLVGGYMIAVSPLVEAFIVSLGEGRLAASFLVGMFFTSIFTATPATVALGEIAQVEPLLPVALMAGLGAVFGDLVLIKVIRRIARLLHPNGEPAGRKKAARTLHVRGWLWKFKTLRALQFVLGAIIIASPLPDELGLALMSRTRLAIVQLIPVLFLMNTIGVYLVGALARANA